MTIELKPCPFCDGGASDHVKIAGAKCCAQCGAIEGGWRGTATRPIGWNTRPIEDALRAEVEALREEAGKAQRMCCELADDNARLKAELEKYTQPLTLVQIDEVDVAVGGWFKAGPSALDAAIRAAREGAK